MTAAYPYTCQTGRYTVDQLDGEACAECGEWFQIGEDTVPTGTAVDGAQLFRHEQCPEGWFVAMTTITPTQAQQHIDRAFVLRSLAEIHTTWGDSAWNHGNYPAAVRHWQTAARYSLDAARDGEH